MSREQSDKVRRPESQNEKVEVQGGGVETGDWMAEEVMDGKKERKKEVRDERYESTKAER